MLFFIFPAERNNYSWDFSLLNGGRNFSILTKTSSFNCLLRVSMGKQYANTDGVVKTIWWILLCTKWVRLITKNLRLWRYLTIIQWRYWTNNYTMTSVMTKKAQSGMRIHKRRRTQIVIEWWAKNSVLEINQSSQW